MNISDSWLPVFINGCFGVVLQLVSLGMSQLRVEGGSNVQFCDHHFPKSLQYFHGK